MSITDKLIDNAFKLVILGVVVLFVVFALIMVPILASLPWGEILSWFSSFFGGGVLSWFYSSGDDNGAKDPMGASRPWYKTGEKSPSIWGALFSPFGVWLRR